MIPASRKDNSVVLSLILAGTVVSAFVAPGVEGFSPPSCARTATKYNIGGDIRRHHIYDGKTTEWPNGSKLFAAKSGEGGKKKRRRRKRKKGPPQQANTDKPSAPAPAAPAPAAIAETSLPPATTVEASSKAEASTNDSIESPPPTFEGEEINVDDIKNVADFSFSGTLQSDDTPIEPPPRSTVEEGSIPLPDIRDTLRRKKMEVSQKGGGGAMEDNMPKTKIDRKDRAALMKLLEQDPYADGDDSFFFEQEYTSISAWLGEGTKPFLGIPTGPLQVGHFIGALVIVLMAYIEYPGFPLTNLPTPLRGALQGGLGTIYSINALLCIVTFFKAQERGQSAPLWIAKTLGVGGLALDQLTQLPTLKEIEAAKARKGKRALKNQKR